MNIGMYHFEMWHRGKAAPNLELMKIYRYYYEKGDKVTLMRPGDDEGRFNKIYYFKEYPNTVIPKTLSVYGPNKSIFGYGFYRKTDILPPEIFKLAPLYYLYDAFTDKLSSSIPYPMLKNNSLIRVETNDFADYKPNAALFIADYNICDFGDKAVNFLEEYKNKSLHYLYQPHLSCAALPKFSRYSALLSPRIVDFEINVFIEECRDSNITFPIYQLSKETLENYRLRLLKMGLIYKSKDAKPITLLLEKPNDEFCLELINWIKKGGRISFINFTKEPEIQKQIENNGVEFRVLSKANPLTFNPQNLTC